MASPTPYAKLSPAAQKLAMARFHARQDAKTPLTPAQTRQAALAQVVAPGLTQGALNKIVGADTSMKYGQPEADLRAQPARVNAAFAAYKAAIAQGSNQLTGSGPQLGGSYGGAVQGVKDLQGGLDQAAKDQWAGQQAAMSADAASRGATVDPTLADVAHNASNVRNILTGSYGAMLVGQGANARQQYADRGVTAEQQRGETLGQAGQKLNELLREKGAFKTSDAASQISAANSNYLKQYLAQNTGLNTASEVAARASQTKIGQQNANTSATRASQSHSQWAQSSNKYGVTNGEWANWSDAKRQSWIKSLPSSKNKGGGLSVTPLQKTSRTSDFRKVMHNATLLVGKIPNWNGLAPNARVTAIYNAVSPDYSSTNQDILMGAIQQAVLGHVGPNTRKALARLGVDPSYWKAGTSSTAPVSAGGTTAVPVGPGGRKT